MNEILRRLRCALTSHDAETIGRTTHCRRCGWSWTGPEEWA